MKIECTQNFAFEEFGCRCGDCCFDGSSIEPALIIVLEDLRSVFGARIIINSGIRCEEYNTLIGGARSSRHLPVFADAADIQVEGVSPKKVFEYLDNTGYRNLLGLGLYASWVHVDTRGYRSRWGN